jgi:hypothetical protein
MKEAEYLKKYDLAPNLKEVAKEAFRAGYQSYIDNNDKLSKMQKRIEHLEWREKDLEKCLLESNFYI